MSFPRDEHALPYLIFGGAAPHFPIPERNPMQYQIVQVVDGATIVSKPTDVMAWAEISGFPFLKLEDRPSLRAELIGQPKFSGLNGPMYGGPGIVRYESNKAYEEFSR